MIIGWMAFGGLAFTPVSPLPPLVLHSALCLAKSTSTHPQRPLVNVSSCGGVFRKVSAQWKMPLGCSGHSLIMLCSTNNTDTERPVYVFTLLSWALPSHSSPSSQCRAQHLPREVSRWVLREQILLFIDQILIVRGVPL